MKTSKPTYNTTAVFIAGCIGMCFFGISMIALGAVLPALGLKFGLSGQQITGLVTSLPVGILGGSLVFGPIVDRFGHKILLICSCALVLLGVLGVAATTRVDVLTSCIFAIGFGGGILNGETNALVTDIYEGTKRTSRLSLLGVFYGVGALTLPVLLARLQAKYSYETVFIGLGAIMLLGVIYCMTVRFPAPKQPEGFSIKDVAAIITSPVLLLLSFVLFFQSGIESITNNWTTSYLISAGEEESTALTALTAMLIGLTAARVAQTALFSYIAPMKVLVCSLLITAIGYAMLLQPSGAWMIWLAMALVGAGLASTFPVIFGILGDRFARLSGTAFSISLVIALCGQTTLNFTTGQLAVFGKIGAFPLLVIGSIAAMLVLLGVYICWVRRPAAAA